MSDNIQLKPVKVRAWKLAEGGFLVLLFIRRQDDKLELLAELHAEDEAGITAIVDDVRARLDQVTGELGIEGRAYAEFAGAKKA